MITEDDFRQALREQVAPLLADVRADAGLLETLRRHQARRNRLRIAGAGLAVVAVAVGATALVTLVPGSQPDRLIPPTASSAPIGSSPGATNGPSASVGPAATTGAVPLITTGDCAGLTVTAAVQSAGAPTWRIAPGDVNAITVPGGILMYFQASGPCTDALTYRTSGDLLQGPAADAAVSRFNDQGIGVVVTHNVSGGTQDIGLWLGCAASAEVCNGNPQEVAVIAVTVVPRSVQATSMPIPSAAESIGAVGPLPSPPVPGSVQGASACSAAQLALDYPGVTFGTGMDVAPLRVRDVSAEACTLTGGVTVVGLDAGGRAVTTTRTYVALPDLVLSARAPRLAAGAAVPAGVSIAWIPITATVRDAGGYCPNLVVPKAWSVTIGGSAIVTANGDGNFPLTTAEMSTGAFGACGGQLARSVGEDQVAELS